MISATENAQKQIDKILMKKNKKFFRITVNSGGCNGFMYDFSLDDLQDHDDIIIGSIIIDSISKPFLENAQIDFSLDSIIKKEFIINNPNTSKSCGCNRSFA